MPGADTTVKVSFTSYIVRVVVGHVKEVEVRYTAASEVIGPNQASVSARPFGFFDEVTPGFGANRTAARSAP